MKTEFPMLKTDRLLLRQITDADLESVYLGLSDPEVNTYYGVSFNSIESTKEQMNWFANLEETRTGIWWAISSSDNQTFYGAGGLNNISQDHHKAEIGFWLIPGYWGKGIMAEAMPLICDYGFNTLNLHRIEGFVESENKNCKRAMAKMNFEHEGTMTDCEMKNGRYISIDIYAKINSAEIKSVESAI